MQFLGGPRLVAANETHLYIDDQGSCATGRCAMEKKGLATTLPT